MPQKHKIRHTGPHKPKMCGGKRCYSTRREAEQVKSQQEIINTDLVLATYYCIACGSWHLTRKHEQY